MEKRDEKRRTKPKMTDEIQVAFFDREGGGEERIEKIIDSDFTQKREGRRL